MSLPNSAVLRVLERLESQVASLCLHEVVLANGRPALGRCWMGDTVHSNDVGTPVSSYISEPDESVVLAFNAFVRSDSHPERWFTFVTCELTEVTRLHQVRQFLCEDLTDPAFDPIIRVKDFFAILDTEGRPQSTSSDAPCHWQRLAGLARLEEAAGFLADSHRIRVLIPGYLVEMRPMVGADNKLILACFSPVGVAPRPELAALSPTQGRVVRFAAAGATTPEIARAMRRSAGTVRTHLREAYRRLDVASRLELTVSSDELSGWGAR
jgi:DNA-binding CsgD family transcriptional regulator